MTIDDEPKTPRDLLKTIVETEDKDGLHDWILLYLKVDIPQKSICEDHCAPFDFVADYVFDKFKTAIVLANRNGGKTYDFAILDTVMSYLYPKVEIATVGAIQTQAQKCYNYFKKYTQRFPFAEHVTQQSMKRTEFDQEQVVEIVTGTVTGVNSPHPQLLFIDEIDLMLWFILQQAFSMPQSAHGIESKMVLTSTRKFAGGVMQRSLDEADKNGDTVYKWCIWEVIEKLPDDPDKLAEIYRVLGSELPEKITEADGFYSWDDVLVKKDKLDDDVWQAEWLCNKPGIEGLIYGTAYDEANNVLHDWEVPDDKPGYHYIFEDFGYSESHPNVQLLIWIPISFDRLIVYDEIYYTKGLFDDLWKVLDDRLHEYGQSLPDPLTKKGGTIKGWVGDPHGLTELEERRRAGAPLVPDSEKKGAYVIANGIPIVKKFLSSGRVMIHERCSNLRTELQSYKYKKNIDGTYSRITEKKNDHGPDALRYGLVALEDALTYNWLKRVTRKDPRFDKKMPEIVVNNRKKSNNLTNNVDKPLTAGLMDKRF